MLWRWGLVRKVLEKMKYKEGLHYCRSEVLRLLSPLYYLKSGSSNLLFFRWTSENILSWKGEKFKLLIYLSTASFAMIYLVSKSRSNCSVSSGPGCVWPRRVRLSPTFGLGSESCAKCQLIDTVKSKLSNSRRVQCAALPNRRSVASSRPPDCDWMMACHLFNNTVILRRTTTDGGPWSVYCPRE